MAGAVTINQMGNFLNDNSNFNESFRRINLWANLILFPNNRTQKKATYKTKSSGDSRFLVPDDVDRLDGAELGEVVEQRLLGDVRRQAADVYLPIVGTIRSTIPEDNTVVKRTHST